MLRKINNDESGVVLVTALLFLMIVTFLAIAGIQNPKSDIEISNNDRYYTQSQQLSNLAAMEAKNWLLAHYSDKTKIENRVIGTTVYVLSVDGKVNADLNTTFNQAGIMPCIDNCDASGVGVRPIVKVGDNQVGEYSWQIVNTSDESNSTAVDTYVNSLISNGALITEKHRKKYPIQVKQNVALDKDRAEYQFYHVNANGYAYSESSSIGVVARSEAMVAYTVIVPNQN